MFFSFPGGGRKGEGQKEWHITGDIEAVLARGDKWGVVALFPPCQFLSSVGARWLDHPKHPDRRKKRDEAAAFVQRIWKAAVAVAPHERSVPDTSPHFTIRRGVPCYGMACLGKSAGQNKS